MDGYGLRNVELRWVFDNGYLEPRVAQGWEMKGVIVLAFVVDI